MNQFPKQFSHYWLFERIAYGGMGELLLAADLECSNDQLLCMKHIHAHLSQNSRERELFLREAKLAKVLKHPNIVATHDIGEYQGTPYIAMEYLSGLDMRSIIAKILEKKSYLPIPFALYIAAQAALGLHFAHQAKDENGHPLGVVHRDISPHNIFVEFDGSVKVLDFGVAKVFASHTETGQLKGKLGFMSPEQIRMQPLDARSDIFSLGVCLYEWLTGVQLFIADGEIGYIRAVLEEPIYAPSYLNANIPKELDTIVLKALMRDVKMRYSSALEFQYVIDKFLNQAKATVNSSQIAVFMQNLLKEEAVREERRKKYVMHKDLYARSVSNNFATGH